MRNLLWFVWALWSGFLFAQEGASIERPDLRVGDSWTFTTLDFYSKAVRNEYELSVTDVTVDSIAAVEKAKGSTKVVLNRDLTYTIRGSRTLTTPIERFKFPLIVGNQWKYRVEFVHPRGGPGRTDWAAKVVRWEDITVPAGKYRALRIDHEGWWTHSAGTGRVTMKFWYVPEIKNFAKYEFADFETDGRRLDSHMTELKAAALK